jgi:Na+-driven multidrug efflux pump
MFICGYNGISAILRGCGDSKNPMIFVAFSCILNIIGDLVLTGMLGLGVAGVAIATVGAQAVSMICVVVYLNRQQFIFTFKLSNFRIDVEKAKELAAVGIPISLQECMVRLSFLYLTSVTNRLGVYAASAVGVASKYDVFAMLPATSIANALAAITAQNYGAGKPERAKSSLFAGLGFAVFCSALFWGWAQLSPETMIGVFTKDANIIQEGIPFFRACSYDYLAVTFVFCLNGYLNGRSKTIFTMISCCFGALALRMPIIYVVYTYWPGNMLRIGSIAPVVSGFMACYTLLYVLYDFRKEKTRVPNQGFKNILKEKGKADLN